MPKEVYDPVPDIFSYDKYLAPWLRGSQGIISFAGHGRSDFDDPMHLIEIAVNWQAGLGLFFDTGERAPYALHLCRVHPATGPIEYIGSYENISHFAGCHGQPLSGKEDPIQPPQTTTGSGNPGRV